MDLSKSPNFTPNAPNAATNAVLDRLLPKGYTGPRLGYYTSPGHHLEIDDRGASRVTCGHHVKQYNPMVTDIISKSSGAVTEVRYRVYCGACNQFFKSSIITTAGYGEVQTFNISVTRPEDDPDSGFISGPPNSKTLIIELFRLDEMGRGHSIFQEHVLISGREWFECA